MSIKTLMATAALLLPGVFAATTPPAHAAGYECDGKAATIVGTPGDDVLTGTSGDDVIVGRGVVTRSTAGLVAT
jgi:RTX calcium-binding nonapeptide repeat (4 copies)